MFIYIYYDMIPPHQSVPTNFWRRRFIFVLSAISLRDWLSPAVGGGDCPCCAFIPTQTQRDPIEKQSGSLRLFRCLLIEGLAQTQNPILQFISIHLLIALAEDQTLKISSGSVERRRRKETQNNVVDDVGGRRTLLLKIKEDGWNLRRSLRTGNWYYPPL